jgi:hypothetical protein
MISGVRRSKFIVSVSLSIVIVRGDSVAIIIFGNHRSGPTA